MKTLKKSSPSRRAAKKLIVVVPAFNEEERISETLAALRGIRGEIKKMGLEYRIYVVNDGSSDDTGRCAVDGGADRVLRHKVNQGLGAAVRTGLTGAYRDGADIVVKFDADLQHDPNDIPRLITPILDDESDVVYGNRFERIEYKMPFVRKAGNIVFTAIMRYLTGWPIRDGQPGIFAVNRDYLDVFDLPGSYNYTQQILLDAYHKGMRFAHVSVAFRRRITGKSFVSLRYPFNVLYQIVLVLISVHPMRIFGTFGILSLFAAAAIFTVEICLFFAGHLDKPVSHVNAVLGLLFFGLQTLFFGFLAELIVRNNLDRRR